METHPTTPVRHPVLIGRLRILGRRIAQQWYALPNWMQDGLTAWLIALPLWALLAMTLLVF